MTESSKPAIPGSSECVRAGFVDEQGRIVLPGDVQKALGFRPGDVLLINPQTEVGLTLYRPATLRKYLLKLSHALSLEEDT